MTALRHSLLFSFVESYGTMVLSLASFIILARLLTPQEVGLFSVTTALLTITQVIRDFGLVNFLIQKKDLDESHVGTAWGMALLLGGSLFLIVQMAAEPLGAFYNNQHLPGVARLLAVNFLLLPFNSVCLALLRRDMQFRSVMIFNLTATAASTFTSIGLAWSGAGTYALVAGSLASSGVLALLLWRQSVSHRLRRPNLQHWRELVRFGGPLTASNIVTSAAMDINELSVGKTLGLEAAALLSRAQGVMNLFHRDFMAAVRNVAFPAFAKAHRDGEDVELRYVASVGNVTAVAWTFYGFASLFPLELLRLMFGPQWDGSAPLVPWYCLNGALSAVISLVPTVLMAKGHARAVAAGELGIQPVRILILCSVAYFLRDLTAMAMAAAAISLAAIPYFLLIKQRCLPTAFGALGRVLVRNALLTLLALAPAAALTGMRAHGAALPTSTFLLAAAATAAAWLVALRLLRHPLQQELSSMLRARLRPT